MGQIVEIAQPLADIGIGDMGHAGLIVELDALDRGLGGQAGLDHRLDALKPAAVMSEHPVGLEDIAVLAAALEFRRGQHVVDRLAQIGHRPRQPVLLVQRVLGDEFGDLNLGLVKDRHAFRDALGQRHPFEKMRRAAHEGPFGQLMRIDQIAPADQLGERHGDDLERLDLFFGVAPLGLVLDHDDANHPIAPDDRNAHEGMVDFFARLRPVGEVRDPSGRRTGKRASPARRCGRPDLRRTAAGSGEWPRDSDLQWRTARACRRRAPDRSSTPRRPCSRR